MIFGRQQGDVADLSGEVEAGSIGAQTGEIAVAVPQEDIAGGAVEPAELGEEAELVTAEDQVGVTVVIDIETLDSAHGGELDGGWQPLDAEAAAAFIEGNDGRGEVELFDVRAVELSGREKVLDGAFGVIGMTEVLFFEGRELVFHIVFEEDGHIAVVDGLGEDLIGDAVVIEVIDPEFDGAGRIGAEVEVFADVAQDQVGSAVAIEIGYGQGLPPAVEVIKIGGQFGKMVIGELEDMRGHPVAGDDELVLVVAIQGGPAGGGDHADMGDIGVAGGGDIGKMAMAVVDIDEAGGVGAVFAGDGAAADEQIGEAIAIKVTGDGHSGIDAIGMGREGVGGEGEVAVTVIEEEAVLHLAAIGGMAVAAGADKEVWEAVAIGIEEQDGFVFEVGEGIEGGLGRFDELAGRGLQIELAGMTGGAADKDIGKAVSVNVGGVGFWSFAGEHFGEVRS